MKRNNLNKIKDLRHTLHANAELSMQETKTMQLIKDFLRKNTSLEIADRGQWFYAVKRSEAAGCTDEGGKMAKNSIKIAFRADTDALPIDETIELPYASETPGVSHKCGHDGHAAALCGLALELDQAAKKQDRKIADKSIYLIFQPGEETGEGAVLCKNLIKEKHIDEIYAFHNLSGFPEGALVYHPEVTQPASEGLRIIFTGKTSHAAEPEHGSNPSAAISSTVLYAQAAAQQISTDSLTMCTITGIKVGNGDFGISPGEGEICMTLRAENEDDMKALEQQILDFASEAAGKDHLEISYSIHDYFPETRNNALCLNKVLETAGSLGLSTVNKKELWRPSEDFGYYLKECPGAIFYIGNGTDYPPLHTRAYDFNDNILETAVDMFFEICVTA